MSKWIKRHRTMLLIAAGVLLFGLWYVEIFPDPYHEEDAVNIYTWIYRELDEFVNGEKD